MYKRKRRKKRMIRRLTRVGFFIMMVFAVMMVSGISKQLLKTADETAAAEASLAEQPPPHEPPEIRLPETMAQESVAVVFPEIVRMTDVPLIILEPEIACLNPEDPELAQVAEAVNIQIAARLQEKLSGMGYQVLITGGRNHLPIADQGIKMANHYQADLYLNIRQVTDPHSEMNGVQTWYNGKDDSGDSMEIAKQIQQAVVRKTGVWDRDLRDNAVFSVDESLEVPACMIETGNISKSKDQQILAGEPFQEELAGAIAGGIASYFNPKFIYLTFDDGPSTTYTNKVLDILKEKNIKATFFLVGENVRKNPETTRRIAAEGHAIGIHCNWHDYDKIYQSQEHYLEDFEAAAQIIYETTGVETKLYRFPGSSLNVQNREHLQGLIDTMNARGYIYYDWNVSIEDAVQNTEPEQLIANARAGIEGKNTVILLAHDIVPKTVSCLDELLDELLEQYPEYLMEVLTPEVAPIQFVP